MLNGLEARFKTHIKKFEKVRAQTLLNMLCLSNLTNLVFMKLI
jgi:hypothetical protein